MADPKKLPISSLIFLLPPSVEACSVAFPQQVPPPHKRAFACARVSKALKVLGSTKGGAVGT
jgi:hypothetical protein